MMDQPLKIALAQCNPTVGDIAGNRALLLRLYRQAAEEKADLVVFPEMALTGYPPEDLVLRRAFQDAAMDAVSALAEATADFSTAMITGGIWREDDALHNSAFLIEGGQTIATVHKRALPNYSVFDEKRVFVPGHASGIVNWRGLRLGLFICEDMWSSSLADDVTNARPELIISINASPYEMGKAKRRRHLAKRIVESAQAPLLYLNTAGGQDELVFDGRSFIMHPDGTRPVMLEAFSEQLTMTQWQREEARYLPLPGERAAPQGDAETIYRAMMLGLRDYVEKSGFPGVIISLSGGVDSALTAAVAVDALGAKRVHTVMMPSPYTSAASLEDAAQCAQMLDVSYDVIDIAPGMEVMDRMLHEIFAGTARDTTEENIQARLRANLLMAISNKRGWMVITTGNKSEMSVGYATLYGDMCGGYSVLKDVYKTTVYKLCHWRNAGRKQGMLGPDGAVMPERVITKAPSAELKPDQTDQDTLPPYEVLDAILLELIEHQAGVEDIIAQGFDQSTVRRITHMLYNAEYKRRQAPPGVKITGMSFGRDRRYPIVNKFRE